MNKIIYFVNNNGTMEIIQDNPDGNVTIHTLHNSMIFKTILLIHMGKTTNKLGVDVTIIANYVSMPFIGLLPFLL